MSNRRDFITLLGGAAAAWPLAARAQQPASSRKIGLLHPGESTVVSARIVAIREGLNDPDNNRDSGIEIIMRLADGDLSRLPALTTDLINNHVDAIVAAAPAAVQAAAHATTSIPVIAIDLESDPVASGFVASLARPGRNVTGVFLDFPDFSAKCLQLLIESVPTLSGIGLLWDPSTGSLQLKFVEASPTRSCDVGGTGRSSPRCRPRDAPRIPCKCQIPAPPGPDIQNLYRQIGVMARKVLQGAKVAELPSLVRFAP